MQLIIKKNWNLMNKSTISTREIYIFRESIMLCIEIDLQQILKRVMTRLFCTITKEKEAPLSQF